MNMLTRNIAFTLIELLVVIAVIGILSGLIVVSMNGVTDKANIAKSQVFSNSLRSSLMLNIIGEWSFDGVNSERAAINNDVIDTWGGINNGDVLLPSAHQPTVKTESNCVNSSCLSFDGINDYVDISGGTSLILGTGDYTISTWFKDMGAVFYIISPSTNVTINYPFPHIRVQYSSNQIWIQNAATGGTASFSFTPNGLWHHLVWTRTNGILKAYLDGISKPVSENSLQNGYNFTAGSLNMGDFYYSGSRYYSAGLIDDVRIYNAAVPSSQIKEQYYAGLNYLFLNGETTKEEYISKINEHAKN